MNVDQLIRQLSMYPGNSQREAAEKVVLTMQLGEACAAFSECQNTLVVARRELQHHMNSLDSAIERVGKLKAVEQLLREATIRALGAVAPETSEPVEVPAERVLRRAMDLKAAGDL